MSEKPAHPVQLIQPDGRRVFDREYAPLVRDIGIEQMRSLYEDLVVSRSIDTEATALQRQGELGLWPPLLGQEAAQVGSARALHRDDYVFTSYREHAVAYCRGVQPEQLTALWRGVAHSGRAAGHRQDRHHRKLQLQAGLDTRAGPDGSSAWARK